MTNDAKICCNIAAWIVLTFFGALVFAGASRWLF